MTDQQSDAAPAVGVSDVVVEYTDNAGSPTYVQGAAAWENDLRELAEQAQEPDWDGEGADPIDPTSLEFARDLLSRFPLAAQARDKGQLVCELFPSPHGDVIFYWYDRGEKATLTVFAKPGREVSYSASLPDEDMRGEIRNVQVRPDTLDMAFRKLLAVASAG